MPRGFVLGHDALCHRPVNGGDGFFESSLSGGLVARFDRSQYFLDGRAGMRALAGVPAAVMLCLTSPFAS